MLVLRWSRLQSYQWMKLNESWKCNLSTEACSLKSLSSQLLLLNRQFLHIVAIYVCVINVSLIQIIVIDSRFLISMTLQCSHVECCVTQVCSLWRDDCHNCSDSAPNCCVVTTLSSQDVHHYLSTMSNFPHSQHWLINPNLPDWQFAICLKVVDSIMMMHDTVVMLVVNSSTEQGES